MRSAGPLFVWLRRQGRSPQDAEDLTQSFLAHLMQDGRLQSVAPQKGMFRSFLLVSLKNFLNNERDRACALKRGGQFVFVSADEMMDRQNGGLEFPDQTTPDQAYDRSWAMTLLDSIVSRLREEHAVEHKSDLFDALQPYLSGDRGGLPYSETAARLGMGESALKMAVLRLRRRFGEKLRAEIAHTVTTPQEVDEEIRSLFAAVSA